MIVVPIILISAITGKESHLGTLVIDRQGGDGVRNDYRARAYHKNAARNGYRSMILHTVPHRTGMVEGHHAKAEPAGNLVAKALKVLGYG